MNLLATFAALIPATVQAPEVKSGEYESYLAHRAAAEASLRLGDSAIRARCASASPWRPHPRQVVDPRRVRRRIRDPSKRAIRGARQAT